MAGCIVLQFIRPARNQNGQAVQDGMMKTFNVPGNVYSLLRNACFDCHSNNTSYPWYFNVQPVGWMLANDIENGKAMLNFSDLYSLSPRRQISKLQEVENRIKDGTMPLTAYKLMHPSARLTSEQRQQLVDWIQSTKDNIDAHR